MRLSDAVLLPSYNEAESIRHVIWRTRLACPDARIYVVDGGSTDGTTAIARDEGCVLIEAGRRGKGYAIAMAFKLMQEDRAVLLDSDSSYLPEEIPMMLSMLDKHDIVSGSRMARMEPGSMSRLNRIGNMLLTLAARILFGGIVTDVCTGFWAFNKRAYKTMRIDAPHFGLEANLYAEARRTGLSYGETRISYVPRIGESKITVLHGIDIAVYMLWRRIIY